MKLTCKYCPMMFESLLIPQEDALNESLGKLVPHVHNVHPREFASFIQLMTELVAHISGMVTLAYNAKGEDIEGDEYLKGRIDSERKIVDDVLNGRIELKVGEEKLIRRVRVAPSGQKEASGPDEPLVL